MRGIQKSVRKTLTRLLDRGAVSHAVSATIFTGVVVALSIAVMVWARSVSWDYAQRNSEIVDDDIARLKERLAVEYVFYDGASDEILVYLLNYGTIDDVSIKSVRVRNADSTWTQLFSGLSVELDVGEEDYVTLSGATLTDGAYYHIRITTARGAMFDSGFVA